MASFMNIGLLSLLVVAASYVSPAMANVGPVTALTLTGTVYCTTDGNPAISCGRQSCPPAVNATVILAVRRTTVAVANTTTNTNGVFTFNIVFNATNPTITLAQETQLVAYVPLPVAGCTSLSGAGILLGILGTQITTQTPLTVGLNLVNFIRF